MEAPEGLLIGTSRETDEPVFLPMDIINRHFGIIATTGQGKTVFGKSLIEECVLSGIPSIIIDPQGDLARLAISGNISEIESKNGDIERAKKLNESIEVRIWTPTRKKGLPLSLNPFNPPGDIDPQDLVNAWDMMAAGIAGIAGFPLNKAGGTQVQAVIYGLMTEAARQNIQISGFTELANLLDDPSILYENGELDQNQFNRGTLDLLTRNKREELSRRLRTLDVGSSNLIFKLGPALDIDLLLEPAEKGKIPVNVIFLKTLVSSEAKMNFVQEFSRTLYDWMLLQDSNLKDKETRLMFFLDEVAPFAPSHPNNPPSKEMIKLLFKQGRKCGVSCVLATQNFADVDYKILGQANTLVIGKLTQKRDHEKVRHMIKSEFYDVIDSLPELSQGTFEIVNSDISSSPISIKSRWLYTDHGNPLNEDEVEKLVPDSLRSWAKEKETGTVENKTPIPPQADIIRERAVNDDLVAYEAEIMGGLSFLRDSRDPLMVMMSLNNLATAIVFLLCSGLLLKSWGNNEIHGLSAILGLLASFTAVALILIDAMVGPDQSVTQAVRRRAKPIQYGGLIWIWILWFLTRSSIYPLESILIPIEIVQTTGTLFIVLEFAHRISINRIQMPEFGSIGGFLKSSFQSMKGTITSFYIEKMRASSTEILGVLRLIMDLVLVMAISSLFILKNIDISDPWAQQLFIRILAIHALLFLSQVIVAFNTRKSN